MRQIYTLTNLKTTDLLLKVTHLFEYRIYFLTLKIKKNMVTFIIIIFAILLIVLLALSKTNKPKLDSDFFDLRPYLSKKPLTDTETKFYHLLVKSLPEHIILAQVQLSSILKVDSKQIENRDFYRWFKPISQQSVDYLICNHDFSIIAAIELDDKSHNNSDAFARDEKKTKNLKAANIPLIRWHAEAMPDYETIRSAINRYSPIVGIQNAETTQWIDQDEIEDFLSRPRKPTASLFYPIYLIALLIVVFLLGGNLFKTIFQSSIITQATNQPQASAPQMQKQNDLVRDLLLKQQQDKLALEEARRQAQISQQLLNQQQEQQRINQIQEASKKEEAWNRFYKNRFDCSTQNDIVKCGNDHIRNRRKFEQEWEAQRISRSN